MNITPLKSRWDLSQQNPIEQTRHKYMFSLDKDRILFNPIAMAI